MGDQRVPMRTCVGCRRRRPKRTMLRVAATPDGVRADPSAHLPGRGAYVCPDPTCLDAAESRDGQAVRRALRGGPAEQVIAALQHLRTAVRAPTPDGAGTPSAPKERQA